MIESEEVLALNFIRKAISEYLDFRHILFMIL